jgi:hypothetical protein
MHRFENKQLFLYSRAYEVWGSPEMLNIEKAKRTKVRQEEYEGKNIFFNTFS